MLSRISDIIYPSRCEVVEIPDVGHIYPIYKNGSGSITEYAKQMKYKFLINEQIRKLSAIDIILRDPQERFISGFNTFVYNTKISQPELDLNTIIYFAETYLFLNRHYAPQLSWIINLSKFINPNCRLRMHSMASINKFTPWSIRPHETNILTSDNINKLKNNIYNELYLRLDNYLLELISQELTFGEILIHLKKDPVAYQKLSCIALD